MPARAAGAARVRGTAIHTVSVLQKIGKLRTDLASLGIGCAMRKVAVTSYDQVVSDIDIW